MTALPPVVGEGITPIPRRPPLTSYPSRLDLHQAATFLWPQGPALTSYSISPSALSTSPPTMTALPPAVLSGRVSRSTSAASKIVPATACNVSLETYGGVIIRSIGGARVGEVS